MLFYQRHMSPVLVLLFENILQLHHVHVNILLRNILALPCMTVPAFVEIIGIEYHVAPPVEYPHFVFGDEQAFTVESIVVAILIGSKGIRYPEGEVGRYYYSMHDRTVAPVRIRNCKSNIECSGILVGVTRILQRADRVV